MSRPDPDVHTEIMEATHDALCTHGFTALTMQDIADECDKSKSLLHYHYDTKEELLVSFVEFLLESFEARVEEIEHLPPAARLIEFLDWFVFDPEDSERARFHLALLEFRSQGAFDDRYRDQLRRSDDLLRETLEEIFEEGIEEGVFEPVDVPETAATIVATIDGARTRQITLDRSDYTPIARDVIVDRLIEPVLAPGVSLPEPASDHGMDRPTDDPADSIVDR